MAELRFLLLAFLQVYFETSFSVTSFAEASVTSPELRLSAAVIGTSSVNVNPGGRPMAEGVINLVTVLPLPLRINSMVSGVHVELKFYKNTPHCEPTCCQSSVERCLQ